MAANMLNDIVSAHKERILNLKKYYPFFKLTEISFSQFKDGKYAVLDMGYIVTVSYTHLTLPTNSLV